MGYSESDEAIARQIQERWNAEPFTSKPTQKSTGRLQAVEGGRPPAPSNSFPSGSTLVKIAPSPTPNLHGTFHLQDREVIDLSDDDSVESIGRQNDKPSGDWYVDRSAEYHDFQQLSCGQNPWDEIAARDIAWFESRLHGNQQSTRYGQGAFEDSAHKIIDSAGNLLNDGWTYPGNESLEAYARYVQNDPTKNMDEIKSLLQNIRPDMEIPPENREGTPDAMVYPLMEHQKLGLAWLKQMEESKTAGGILADDMGLGKTIQALALIVSRPSNEKYKTTLIVAPVGLLKQWEREIQKKLKPEAKHRLSVHIFHNGGKKRVFSDLAKYDVVLTTFGTVASEYRRLEKWKSESQHGVVPTEPNLTLLSGDAWWYRVIIDEAQCIKNKDTQSSKGCCSLRADYRLCLSGTPMQNSCDELFSLLRFLQIKPYNTWSNFSATFSRPLKRRDNGSPEDAMKKLQALLKAVLLRRTKESQIDGKPILSLPPKVIEMVHATFSQDELDFYTSLETKTKIQFNKYLRQGTVGKNYSNLLVLLLRLRQACCHPHLISDLEEVPEGKSSEAVLELAKEIPGDAVSRIKSIESLECPVCLDICGNPSLVIPCGHSFCPECIAQLQTQQEERIANEGEGTQKIKCPGCRGPLDINKMIDLRTFRTIYQPELLKENIDDVLGIERDDSLIYDSESDDEDHDVDGYGNLRNFVVRDGDDRKSRMNSSKGKKKAGAGRPVADVRREAGRNEKSKRLYQRFLKKRWVDSAKKTIIFSQFTSLLDLVEVPLSETNLEYRRYDGGMSSARRNDALMEFQDDESIKVLLVSLKAGNSGLNLVMASQVIIFADPFYNPFVELQAIDRAHRIGQQRRVIVHRLVIPGTVEDRVLALQDRKKALIQGALDNKAVGKLTHRDLGFLFVSFFYKLVL
ncbi:SNF2 family N-terminal domain-containing protein [Geopyxis carbonaria]|nr:SNF2 family N-terminal domain-containing protein [Geopyxis carbonaria]